MTGAEAARFPGFTSGLRNVVFTLNISDSFIIEHSARVHLQIWWVFFFFFLEAFTNTSDNSCAVFLKVVIRKDFHKKQKPFYSSPFTIFKFSVNLRIQSFLLLAVESITRRRDSQEKDYVYLIQHGFITSIIASLSIVRALYTVSELCNVTADANRTPFSCCFALKALNSQTQAGLKQPHQVPTVGGTN